MDESLDRRRVCPPAHRRASLPSECRRGATPASGVRCPLTGRREPRALPSRLRPQHANFIENTGTATTADVIAVMAEGRRRVLERFGVELEPEVQTLGDVRCPWSLGVRL